MSKIFHSVMTSMTMFMKNQNPLTSSTGLGPEPTECESIALIARS